MLQPSCFWVCVYSIPPLSVVGLSEEQAIEQANGDVLVFTSRFNPMKNTISGRQEKMVMKLIVDGETDKVLGASICGPDAAEIMQIDEETSNKLEGLPGVLLFFQILMLMLRIRTMEVKVNFVVLSQDGLSWA